MNDLKNIWIYNKGFYSTLKSHFSPSQIIKNNFKPLILLYKTSFEALHVM